MEYNLRWCSSISAKIFSVVDFLLAAEHTRFKAQQKSHAVPRVFFLKVESFMRLFPVVFLDIAFVVHSVGFVKSTALDLTLIQYILISLSSSAQTTELLNSR